jgi:hypothetical protein
MTRRVLSSDTSDRTRRVDSPHMPRTLGWMSILLASFVLLLVYAVATYVIELHGAGGLLKERSRIVDRDVDATLR